MDDFNTLSLTESRNEYCALFINKLTPLLVQGIHSIFNEAHKLCIDNDEDEKYLMTFQNFLGRISKWNQDLVNTETERIIQESGCSYLEDLLTCVHITQLKILTSVRVGQKQKKIDIDIPKLQDFIHKAYIEIARKTYKNVFLFELDIMPLEKQKHMRELEILIKESIINVIRNNMPIEEILRAYVDETTEEDVYEIKETTTEVIEDVSANILPDEVITADMSNVDKTPKSEATQTEIIVNKSNELSTVDSSETSNVEESVVKEPLIEKQIEDIVVDTTPIITNTVNSTATTSPINVSTNPTTPSTLEFNPIDGIKTYDSSDVVTQIKDTTESEFDAPKTIERLEQISNMRHEQRKLEEEEEEEDEDSIKIHTDTNLNLSTLDVHDISKQLNLKPPPLLGEITMLA